MHRHEVLALSLLDLIAEETVDELKLLRGRIEMLVSDKQRLEERIDALSRKLAAVGSAAKELRA